NEWPSRREKGIDGLENFQLLEHSYLIFLFFVNSDKRTEIHENRLHKRVDPNFETKVRPCLHPFCKLASHQMNKILFPKLLRYPNESQPFERNDKSKKDIFFGCFLCYDF